MSSVRTQRKWLKAVIKDIRSKKGVEVETINNGHYKIIIRFKGNQRIVVMGASPKNSRIAQKQQYAQLRRAMEELGIEEKIKFRAEKRLPKTPDQKSRDREIDDWQSVWDLIRRAEKSLDR